jgi:hypothetical protein
MWNCHSFQLREPRAVMTWHPGISGQYVPRALGSSQGGDLSRLAETMRSTVRLLELWEPSIATLSFDGRTPYLPPWAHSKINCVENRSDSGPGGPDTLYRPMITTVSNTPANQFVCSYTGCVDKYTRKPRSFRRRAHLERHEATVHRKITSPVYHCWVPGCNRPFTRYDNLQGHLRAAHAGRSKSRNRYVATLDKKSPLYDLRWKGELDEQGYPIRSPRLLEAKYV